ncbi:MAG: hypothetical protein ACLFRT_05320 [Actinomycetota bacterium]
MRRVIAALIVLGLAIGVVLLWPEATTEETPDTLAGPTTSTSTSTSTPPTSTTTTVPNSTTTTADSHVVETVEEAEAILRELWFGWFEGIYNEDEDRIREVVGNPKQVDLAVSQFGVMGFESRPTRSGINMKDTELLHTDDQCLAVWSEIDATSIVGQTNDGVHVFRRKGDSWLFVSQWAFREDRWEDDCQSQLG